MHRTARALLLVSACLTLFGCASLPPNSKRDSRDPWERMNRTTFKVNMALDRNKMEWLIKELSKTECPMTCPHGRPIVLRYPLRDIQKAFKRL